MEPGERKISWAQAAIDITKTPMVKLWLPNLKINKRSREKKEKMIKKKTDKTLPTRYIALHCIYVKIWRWKWSLKPLLQTGQHFCCQQYTGRVTFLSYLLQLNIRHFPIDCSLTNSKLIYRNTVMQVGVKAVLQNISALLFSYYCTMTHNLLIKILGFLVCFFNIWLIHFFLT